jgi:hypothetical protein
MKFLTRAFGPLGKSPESQDRHLVQSTLMFAALMTGHHLSISAA